MVIFPLVLLPVTPSVVTLWIWSIGEREVTGEKEVIDKLTSTQTAVGMNQVLCF
jgi:hypothetical protein